MVIVVVSCVNLEIAEVVHFIAVLWFHKLSRRLMLQSHLHVKLRVLRINPTSKMLGVYKKVGNSRRVRVIYSLLCKKL
mgnify:CR=1 FL=1